MPFDNAIVFVDISGEQADVLLARLAQRGDPMAGLRYRQPGTDFVIGGQPYSSTKKNISCVRPIIFLVVAVTTPFIPKRTPLIQVSY